MLHLNKVSIYLQRQLFPLKLFLTSALVLTYFITGAFEKLIGKPMNKNVSSNKRLREVTDTPPLAKCKSSTSL